MNKMDRTLQLDYRAFASPLGWLLLGAGSKGICLLHFCGAAEPSREACETVLKQIAPHAAARPSLQNPLLQDAKEAILIYFKHCRPLPSFLLDVEAGTSFQRQVWQALCAIPFGETRSYQQVAHAIGKPRSSRAVGQACGSNPIPIFIPCHRVIATSGKLGGYSSGLPIKEALLLMEQDTGRGKSTGLSSIHE
jgi:methylated-DNA-[protein]-cysteine S-methyltransferase